MEASEILRAGGIAAPDSTAPKELRCAPIDARVFEHPALPGRSVVRLVVAPIAPGVDVEMETLGFEKKRVLSGLGKQRYRALGFPGWPLVHDPTRAKFALEVMKDFKKAAHQVKSKPGHARDAFLAIGERLARSVPHFLPSFWEEAGRSFVAEESTSFAAQCFEKARSAEKEHNLAVDEDVRSAVYLEFALAGAVAAKSLAGYAKELAEAYGPKDAYERFLELAIRRVLGGMQPWTGVAKDLRALAKAASLDLDKEDRRFLAEVIDAPAMVRAPGEFWSSYRASLIALARESPAARTRLRHLFPKPTSGASGFAATWLAFLEESGALAGVIDAKAEAAEPKGGAASYLAKVIEYLDRKAGVIPLLEKCAPRLREEAVPVALAPATQWRCQIDIDVAERALALSVPVADPPPAAVFNLAHLELDPVTVQADARYAGKLLDAVESVLGQADFEARAQGKIGLGKARSAWLERELDRLARCALPGLERTLVRLREKARTAIFAAAPGSLARVEATDVAEALARTLRGGLFAELTWPIFEETYAKLAGQLPAGTTADPIAVVGAYPHPILKTTSKVVVLGAERVLAEHDIVVPPKSQVQHVVWADGELLVPFWAPEVGLRAYWASAPHDPFTTAAYFHWYGEDVPISIDLPGVGVSFGHRAIRRGDREVQAGFRQLVSDGQSLWQGEWSDGRFILKEIDPRTGNTGRASWPAFAEEMSKKDDGLRIRAVALAPLPTGVASSPFGSKDGLVGAITRGPKPGEGGKIELTTIDGRRWEGHTSNGSTPVALMKWPGDELHSRPIMVDSVWAGVRKQVVSIVGADGYVASALREAPWASRGWPAVPPLSLWSYLKARDEHGSRALRAIDGERAKRLLQAASIETDAKSMTKTRAAVREILPEITAPALIEGVAAACLEAATRQGDIAKLIAERSEPSAPEAAAALMDSPVLVALSTFVDTHWSGSRLSSEMVAVSRALAFGGEPQFQPSAAPWHDWIDRARAIGLLAASPAVSAETRTTLTALLTLVRSLPLLREGTTLRRFEGSIASTSPVRPTLGNAWTASFEQSRYFFRGNNVNDTWVVTALELSADGSFCLPPGVTLVAERRITIGADAAWLDQLLKLLAEKGARTHSAEEIESIAAGTGLTRPEATLLASGLPKINDYGNDFLGKEARERLGGLKTADAKVARDTFKGLDRRKLFAVYAAAAPDQPAEIWGDLSARFVGAWNEQFGQRAALREELVLSLEREVDPGVSAAALLSALQSPRESSLLTVLPMTFDQLFEWTQVAKTDGFRFTAAEAFALFLPWMVHSLPVGDPDRARLPSLHQAILKTLADPRLLMPLATGYVEEKHKESMKTLVEAIGGKSDPIRIGNEQSIVARDAGALVGATCSNGLQARFAFRPGELGDSGMAYDLAKDSGFALHRYPGLAAVAFLRSPGLAAMIARVQATPVPAGGFEANPAAACSALVDEVAGKKKLTRETATHYLQLLALQEPTQKSVTTWNGWKTGVYKETCLELVRAKLVVEGKRERASREVFLPGGWEKSSKGKNLPAETWKKPLYILPTGAALARILPIRPHHELFEAAWKRVVSGDAPKFEEV